MTPKDVRKLVEEGKLLRPTLMPTSPIVNIAHFPTFSTASPTPSKPLNWKATNVCAGGMRPISASENYSPPPLHLG